MADPTTDLSATTSEDEAILTPESRPRLSCSSVTIDIGSSGKKSPYPQDHTLTVCNHSTLAQPFLVFPAMPSFGNFSIPEEVHTSIYQASLAVAPETGSTTFVFPSSREGIQGLEDYAGMSSVYAITGRAHAKMAPGLRLFATDYTALHFEANGKLEQSSCLMTMPDGFEASFVKQGAEGFTDANTLGDNVSEAVVRMGNRERFPAGTTRISIDHSFDYPSPNTPFVGLGVPNPYHKEEIIPIISWEAVPGSVYVLTPSSIWHCARGKSVHGTIVDLDQWHVKTNVEFSSEDPQTELIYERNGTFTVGK